MQARIVPFRQVKRHTFENLIALCPTCHTRYDNREIDRKSTLQYKANLTILNSRYSDLERRILEDYVKTDRYDIILPPSFGIMSKYLVKDGYVEHVRQFGGTASAAHPDNIWRITLSGKDFVKRWKTAKVLNENAWKMTGLASCLSCGNLRNTYFLLVNLRLVQDLHRLFNSSSQRRIKK